MAIFVLSLPAGYFASAAGQQVADSTFVPKSLDPAYIEGNGPVVFIDEAHNNFHTSEGRFQVFARLLRLDGYFVRSNAEKFTSENLASCDILVISNALGDENVGNWDKPNYSAFTEREVRVINKWVEEGGSILLIADHMPFPAASEKIAKSFGVEFNNGYAMPETGSGDVLIFRRSAGTLLDHPITSGRNNREKVNSFATFTGQAFKVGENVEPILKFGQGYVSFMPEISWDIKPETEKIDITGWYQGAVMRYGKGRAAIFGEAAAFTAQLAGGSNPMGMNHPLAFQNSQLVINVMRWLSGILEEKN
ncbi:DUF4350 domain-containing protein [candidate division KSB1 bacterium]